MRFSQIISRRATFLVAVLAISSLALPVAAERVPALRAYMPSNAFRAAHPAPANTPIYHNAAHSKTVQRMAFQSALARGLSSKQAKFISEVALLHDWDPSRKAGTPARVLETLDALSKDFAGKKALLKGHGGKSVLKERFGWNRKQLKMAIAMIQRTEFPFAKTHPSPAYKNNSPYDRYAAMLKGMDKKSQAFVLREGAVLSEYADKASFYFVGSFKKAVKAVDGLVNEINTGAGKKVMDVKTLHTEKFLRTIGKKQSFALDFALAKSLGVKGLQIPLRDAYFATLPVKYGRAFTANLSGFRAMNRALMMGQNVAKSVKRGQRAAAQHQLPRGARVHRVRLRRQYRQKSLGRVPVRR